jgi:hypothetical protein
MRPAEEVDEQNQDDATELEGETERRVVGMRSCRPEPAAPASGSASGPVRPSKTKDRSWRALVRASLAFAGRSPSAATPSGRRILFPLPTESRAPFGRRTRSLRDP